MLPACNGASCPAPSGRLHRRSRSDGKTLVGIWNSRHGAKYPPRSGGSRVAGATAHITPAGTAASSVQRLAVDAEHLGRPPFLAVTGAEHRVRCGPARALGGWESASSSLSGCLLSRYAGRLEGRSAVDSSMTTALWTMFSSSRMFPGSCKTRAPRGSPARSLGSASSPFERIWRRSAGEVRQVLQPFPQGRQVDRKDCQPIVQVFSELAFLELPFEGQRW